MIVVEQSREEDGDFMKRRGGRTVDSTPKI
jgi:hypothetical protein